VASKKPVIIGLGEILWDLLPDGKMLGGAPANFAYHCMQIGADSKVVSAVGDDELGKEILAKTNSLRLGIEYIQINTNKDTGKVSVKLDNEGHPTYIIHENVAWDFIEVTKKTADLLSSADAICFGSLAQRSPVSRKTINTYLRSAPASCIKVFDINLRQEYFSKERIESSLNNCNILKINDDELEVLSRMFNLGETENQKIEQLISDFDLKLIALTKGESGSSLYTPDEISHFHSPKVKVMDTVGAGDSFTAALIMGLLDELELNQIHKLASEISAFVCTQKEATPDIPKELTKDFNRLNI
jgi:fructokinase